MKKHSQLFCCLGLISLLLFSCNQENQQGDSPNSHKRIVSLNGSISEILCLIGEEDHIVATDNRSTFPPSLSSKPQITCHHHISHEGILAQSPDVVFAVTDELDEHTCKQIVSSGSQLIILPHETSVDGIKRLIKQVVDTLSVDYDVQSILTNIDHKLAEISPFESKPKVLFIYARGAGTLMVAGKDTKVAKVIELAGAANAISEFDNFRPLTAEAIINANPDVILLFSSGLESIEGHEGLLQLPGISETTAGKHKSIIAMDGQYLAGFGPRVGEAVLELNQNLHQTLLRVED